MRGKKTIAIAAACASLLALTAFGTLAYFTADDTATNKFMVATTDPDDPDDELFGVKVTEDVETEPGKVEENDEGGYTYKDIMPGMTLDKNPKVKNSGQYSEFVRVSVTLDKASVWQAVLGEKFELTALVSTIDGTKWEKAGETTVDTTADTITWVYYYKEVLAKDAETEYMFTQVNIPTALTTAQMEELTSVDMVVAAEAIQSENLTTEDGTAVTTPAGAFALFDAQVNGN